MFVFAYCVAFVLKSCGSVFKICSKPSTSVIVVLGIYTTIIVIVNTFIIIIAIIIVISIFVIFITMNVVSTAYFLQVCHDFSSSSVLLFLFYIFLYCFLLLLVIIITIVITAIIVTIIVSLWYFFEESWVAFKITVVCLRTDYADLSKTENWAIVLKQGSIVLCMIGVKRSWVLLRWFFYSGTHY